MRTTCRTVDPAIACCRCPGRGGNIRERKAWKEDSRWSMRRDLTRRARISVRFDWSDVPQANLVASGEPPRSGIGRDRTRLCCAPGRGGQRSRSRPYLRLRPITLRIAEGQGAAGQPLRRRGRSLIACRKSPSSYYARPGKFRNSQSVQHALTAASSGCRGYDAGARKRE
jgi:hypothetical protein